VAVDERRKRRGQGTAGKIKAAQISNATSSDASSDQCSEMLNDTTRTGSLYLTGHQVEIGFADVGFRECRAKFPVIVDDEIKGLVVAVRHNRRGPAPTHRQLP